MRRKELSKTVILVEPGASVREYFESVLTSERYTIKVAGDLNGLRKHLSEGGPVDAILLGGFVPGAISIELFREIRRHDPGLPVIVIFDSATPREIVDVMKCGATNVLVKPVYGEALCSALHDAMAVQRESTATRRPLPPSVFVGASRSMQALLSAVGQVGSSDAPVLIQGETGVGKEVLARQLHTLSPRAGRPFLKVNCAAFPSELMESELFGYNRGAFTGAGQNKPGLFERADTGVILLDEIGDMDLRLQAKLLQVLQDQEFHRVGGTETIRVNVRVIAATHVDLESAVENAGFRADLYYRLNVINLHLPPLRQRREDILPLVQFLLERHSEAGVPAPPITNELEEALLSHDWPGNIRELENVVRKLLILRNPRLLIGELNGRHKQKLSPSAGLHLEQISRAGGDAEVRAITSALENARWNRKITAQLLGIGYKALLYKMKKLGIADLDGPIIPTIGPTVRRPAAREQSAGH